MLAACRLSIVLLATASHAIVLPSARASPAMLKPHNIAPRPSRTLGLRGGSVQATAAVSGFLTGAMAIPAATGIAAIAGSLAYIHQAYIFSLSYGLAMLGIGGAVLVTAPSSLVLTIHAGLVSAYGMRLFAFLLWRQKFQAGYDGAARLKALDKTPPLQRTPIIASTAFFYALMASPLLFHFQSAPLAGAAAACSGFGAAVAAVGLAYEAIADQQKSAFKIACRAQGTPAFESLYTGGLYARSRHANYFGEIVFWVGSFVAGLPALVAGGVPLYVRALRALASGLGLAGILFIMLSATKRLEGRQADAYRKVGGVPSKYYDAYYEGSNALVPKLF